jgi:cob(I)alamin adenosyltransferase
MLARIQNDLFDLGADLATPEMEEDVPSLRITEQQVLRIEQEIDALNANLSDLSSFILPGGSSLSSWLHFARTVARRAEREIASLATEEPINKFAMHFINRLSDHLFVLARVANDNGNADILWVPGAQTGKQK